MKKYHVEFDVETDDAGFTHAPHETTRQYAEGADGFLIGVPIDAVITEIKPAFEAGWYQFSGEASDYKDEVGFWSVSEIEYYGDRFGEHHRRTNPPEPYKKED